MVNLKVVASTLALMALYSGVQACAVATAKAGTVDPGTLNDAGVPTNDGGTVTIPSGSGTLNTYQIDCSGSVQVQTASHQFVGHTPLEILVSTQVLVVPGPVPTLSVSGSSTSPSPYSLVSTPVSVAATSDGTLTVDCSSIATSWSAPQLSGFYQIVLVSPF